MGKAKWVWVRQVMLSDRLIAGAKKANDGTLGLKGRLLLNTKWGTQNVFCATT
jgi:hypothetical protein